MQQLADDRLSLWDEASGGQGYEVNLPELSGTVRITWYVRIEISNFRLPQQNLPLISLWIGKIFKKKKNDLEPFSLMLDCLLQKCVFHNEWIKKKMSYLLFTYKRKHWQISLFTLLPYSWDAVGTVFVTISIVVVFVAVVPVIAVPVVVVPVVVLVVDSWTLSLKFCQNLVSNSWNIANIEFVCWVVVGWLSDPTYIILGWVKKRLSWCCDNSHK